MSLLHLVVRLGPLGQTAINTSSNKIIPTSEEAFTASGARKIPHSPVSVDPNERPRQHRSEVKCVPRVLAPLSNSSRRDCYREKPNDSPKEEKPKQPAPKSVRLPGRRHESPFPRASANRRNRKRPQHHELIAVLLQRLQRTLH